MIAVQSNDDGRAGPRERVLVIFPGALGDLICLAPALRAISRRHREAEVELMAREELSRFAAGRLGMSRAPSRVHSIDRREVALLFSDSGGSAAPAREFFSPFSRIYSFFSAADPRFRRALTAASAPGAVSFHEFRPDRPGHMSVAYLEEIGENSVNLNTGIDLLPDDLEAASRILARIAGSAAFIAIFPGSGSPAKNWPIEQFRALADRIEQVERAVFILGPAEARIENALAGKSVLKDLSLGTVAAIARLSSAFVGVDSGVSHLAAAGAPGVVMFGPTDPRKWAPLGRIEVIRREPISAITPDEVIAALGRIRR